MPITLICINLKCYIIVKFSNLKKKKGLKLLFLNYFIMMDNMNLMDSKNVSKI